MVLLFAKKEHVGGSWKWKGKEEIVTESQLLLLVEQQANKSRGKMLGQGKWLYSEGKQTEKMVDYCPKESSLFSMKFEFLSC